MSSSAVHRSHLRIIIAEHLSSTVWAEGNEVNWVNTLQGWLPGREDTMRFKTSAFIGTLGLLIGLLIGIAIGPQVRLMYWTRALDSNPNKWVKLRARHI